MAIALKSSKKSKPRQWNPWWGVGISSLSIIILVVVVIVISRYYIGNPPEDTKAAIPGILGVLTLAVIAIQVWINQRQWQAMQTGLTQTHQLVEQGRGALDFTKSSFYRAERAYLAIRNVHPTYYEVGGRDARLLRADADPQFAFEIVNGGRTPAFDVTAVVYSAFSSEPPENVSEWTRSMEMFSQDFIMSNEPAEFTSTGNAQPNADMNDVWDWSMAGKFYYVKIALKYWDIGEEPQPRKATYVFNYHIAKGGVIASLDTDTMPHRNRAIRNIIADQEE